MKVRQRPNEQLWLAAFVLVTLLAVLTGTEFHMPLTGAAFWLFATVILLALR